MRFSKVAIALDLWQDNIRKVHHLGATAHYLKRDESTDKLELVSRILKLWPMDADLPKDAARVNDAINEVLAEFDLLQHKDELEFITDRGGNLVNSLDGYARRNCLNHFINNLAKEAINRTKKIVTIKNRIVRLIKFLKCNGRCANLSGNLESFAPTRWNSFYMVLASFIEVYDEIRDKIPTTNAEMLGRFNGLDKETLIKVRDFLKPFYKITKELEYDTEITATRILPSYEYLLTHLASSDSDIAEVKDMKVNAMDYFGNHAKNVFPNNYEFWAFFDPRFRNMNGFKTINTLNIMDRLQLYAEINFGDASNVVSDSNNNITADAADQDTSQASLYLQFQDSSVGQSIGDNNSVISEIEYYLKMPFDKNETILEFWSRQKKQLPKLYKFFCSFAAIPATSASVERMFSDCGNILTAKRNRLANDTIDKLAFMHKNL